MEDYLQRFRLFHAAVGLVTKSAPEKGQELSQDIESLLSDMSSVIWRVVRLSPFFFLFIFLSLSLFAISYRYLQNFCCVFIHDCSKSYAFFLKISRGVWCSFPFIFEP